MNRINRKIEYKWFFEINYYPFLSYILNCFFLLESHCKVFIRRWRRMYCLLWFWVWFHRTQCFLCIWGLYILFAFSINTVGLHNQSLGITYVFKSIIFTICIALSICWLSVWFVRHFCWLGSCSWIISVFTGFCCYKRLWWRFRFWKSLDYIWRFLCSYCMLLSLCLLF